MRNIWIRIVAFLTTLYELSCYFVALVFLMLAGCDILSIQLFVLVTFLYYLPLALHYGIFGDKPKEVIDKIMMW